LILLVLLKLKCGDNYPVLYLIMEKVLHKILGSFARFLHIIKIYADNRTSETFRQLQLFGIIFFFNYPVYYFIWVYAAKQTYENLGLRLSASFLCLPLIFQKYWPQSIKRYLSIYWYFTVMYCLPFFFLFMTLKNNGSVSWLLNFMLILFLLFLLLDLISMFVLMLIGCVFALVIYNITTSAAFTFAPGTLNLWAALATLFAGFVIVAIFARNREMIEEARLQTMKSMGASIAHELRTPLRTISSSIGGIKKHLPLFMQAYQAAQKENVKVPYIAPSYYDSLLTVCDDIEAEIQASFNVINVLLIKANQADILSVPHEIISIAACIKSALQRYPFDIDEKQLVHVDDTVDFQFKGNELLMVHVLFNLLKNAFYYIKAAGKGEIWMQLTRGEKTNILSFKDTGPGIPAKYVSRIFDRFFTRTRHGTGLGLTFCTLVMESFGGDISVRSTEGEFTEFTLRFPVLTKAPDDETTTG